MAVNSQMVPLGTPAPDFDLPTIDGGQVALADLDAPVVCVVFACNHCPYVQHVEDVLGRLAEDVDEVAFVAICSNDTIPSLLSVSLSCDVRPLIKSRSSTPTRAGASAGGCLVGELSAVTICARTPVSPSEPAEAGSSGGSS